MQILKADHENKLFESGRVMDAEKKSEKRREERFEIFGNALLNMRNEAVNCQIENLSSYGAYLKVSNPHLPPLLEIGGEVSFDISVPNLAIQKLFGQILRLSLEDGNWYLAVYFAEPYFFGESSDL